MIHTERRPPTQPSLFEAVKMARRTDRATSHAAARKIAPRKASIEQRVGETICAARDGMTMHEAAARLGLSLVTVSPRIAPLVRKGVIRDSGRIEDGRTVWVAA